jgi:RNA polymerase-binding protein DksA
LQKGIQNEHIMSERQRYTDEELKEFEVLLTEKADKARKELEYIKESLTRKNNQDGVLSSVKVLEDGADTAEKESLNQLAVRQQKFIKNMEAALIRIKNGTYGICVDTGKLIPKERLRAVPHTTQSIEAKMAKR